jgi:hypothetical protein
MNELKYLGKPAPKIEAQVMGSTWARETHLEGALKEAAELLVTVYKDWPKEIVEIHGSGREVVAFLLRKTIEASKQ